MASIFNRHGWWSSVTPKELNESTGVVETFLDGEGEAPPHEIEAFARALALSKLFFDPEAVMSAADSASKLMRPSERVCDSKDAVNWLARNQAFVDGLNRCLELLEPQQDFKSQTVVNHSMITASIYKKDLLRSAESDETHAEVRAEAMIREKLQADRFKERKI